VEGDDSDKETPMMRMKRRVGEKLGGTSEVKGGEEKRCLLDRMLGAVTHRLSIEVRAAHPVERHTSSWSGIYSLPSMVLTGENANGTETWCSTKGRSTRFRCLMKAR